MEKIVPSDLSVMGKVGYDKLKDMYSTNIAFDIIMNAYIDDMR